MSQASLRPSLYLPGLAGLYDGLAEWSYPLMRFVVGIMAVPHGMQKMFGAFGGGGLAGTAAYFAKIGLAPQLGYLVAAIEFFGGLCIALGFLTRPAALAFAIEMAVAALYVHLPNGYFWTKLGVEYPVMWGLLALAIAMRGGGKASVDAAIGKEF
jgi:putative oxidoreductase